MFLMADSCCSPLTRACTAYLLCQGDADIVYVYDRGDGVAREECLTHDELVAQLQVRAGEGDLVKGQLLRALERGAARRRLHSLSLRMATTPNANRYNFLDEEGGTAVRQPIGAQPL